MTVLFIYHQISSSLFFVEYVFAAFVLAVLFIIFRSRVEKEDKFILMWVVAMVWFSVASTYIVPWNPQKFPFFLLLPLSVLGAKGALKLSKNYNVGLKKIIIVLVLVAVPNSVLYNINVQVSYRNSERAYMQEEIFGAIERLNDLPQDRVFSSGKTGYFIPYYGGQKTVYFGLGDIEAEKTYDTVRFYNADDTAKLAILKKYGASYVFYGPEEMSIGNASFGKEHFTVVYNNSQVTIYGVAA